MCRYEFMVECGAEEGVVHFDRWVGILSQCVIFNDLDAISTRSTINWYVSHNGDDV